MIQYSVSKASLGKDWKHGLISGQDQPPLQSEDLGKASVPLTAPPRCKELTKQGALTNPRPWPLCLPPDQNLGHPQAAADKKPHHLQEGAGGPLTQSGPGGMAPHSRQYTLQLWL